MESCEKTSPTHPAVKPEPESSPIRRVGPATSPDEKTTKGTATERRRASTRFGGALASSGNDDESAHVEERETVPQVDDSAAAVVGACASRRSSAALRPEPRTPASSTAKRGRKAVKDTRSGGKSRTTVKTGARG